MKIQRILLIFLLISCASKKEKEINKNHYEESAKILDIVFPRP